MRSIMPRTATRLAPVVALLFFLCLAHTDEPSAPPPTPRKPVRDTYQGVEITDDYRWLEKGDDPAVQKWTEEQTRYTRAVLDRSPSLGPLRKRLKELMTAPVANYASLKRCGTTLFALKSQPPREQPFLISLTSADKPEEARVVLDPN